MRQNTHLTPPDWGTLPTFKVLDSDGRARLTQAATARRYAAGEVVLMEGEPATRLGVIVSGVVKAVKYSTDGREQILHLVTPPSLFNNTLLFAEEAKIPAHVVALEDSVIWWIPRDTLWYLVETSPPFARHIIQDMAGRLLHLVNLVENLSLRSVEERLAQAILRQTAAGETVLSRSRWATQAEMASHLGTVPDVLNRAIRQLASEKLIAVSRSEIRILDRDGLISRAK